MTAKKAKAKKPVPAKVETKDQKAFIELGKGLYSDPDDDNMVIINPIELLRAKGLPATQEAAFAVYASVLKDANERGVSVVLINEEGIPSELDLITQHLDKGGPVLSEVPEPVVVEPEWDGVERRRIPR